MLNALWAGMMAAGIFWAAFHGNMGEVTNGLLDSAKEAVTLGVTMLGIMSFWCGILKIGERAGLIEALTKKMRPVIRFLFPNLPDGHPAGQYIATNMIANMLGLGWAATPAGLKAMEELGKLEHRPKVLILSSFPAVAMVFVYGGITWWDALSLIFCYVAVAFMAGSLGIFFSSVFRRSTVSTAVTYGTLIAFVAGTYFINRFALSMSAANLDQTIAVYAMEAPAIRASSGGAFYLFLMNPAFTFMAVIGNQAGRSTSFASVCSYFGMENTGFVMEHWVLLSVLLQLAAGALLLWEAVQFLEPVKKKGKRKNKRMRHTF